MTYQIHFIDTPEAYLNTLERLKDASIYFLDTEFIRERTYRPIVALIQIAINDQEAFLIDPTFEGFEPSLLFNLLDQPDKKVVLHSARQDLEIFYYEYHFSPNNLADTQIMAAALGYGDQIGFDGLVYSITSDVIDKSQQRTNWLLRPLNEKQITYAASDVIYLAKIYPFLEAELHNKKRQAWIADEVSELCDPDIFSITPKMIIKKVRHKLSGKAAIAALHALALFRESLAIEKNLIRTLICPDILLTYLAERRPATIEELQKAKNLKQSAFKHHQEQVLVVIEDARQNIANIVEESEKPDRLTYEQEKLVNILSLAADSVSQSHEVARRLFASQADIIHFVRTDTARFLSGWRHDLFGHIVHDLMSGKKGIYYDNGQIIFKE